MNLSLEATKRKFLRAKRHWLTIAFLLGFVIDNITLNRVDQIFDNIVLLSYVLLAMVSLSLLYAGVAEKLPEKLTQYARAYAPLAVQFSFGGLLSGMLIFYGRSGTWYESWPFLLVILGIIYANETVKDRASRLVLNFAMLFVGIFAYVVLIVPVLTGHMGPWIFLGSGILALIIISWFFKLLAFIVPNFIALHTRAIVFTVGMIFVSLNFLYFTNIIPPIPLSLKEVGIYHSVVRFEDGTYQLTYEEPKWWQFGRDSNKTFRYEPGDNIYCFASVFSPARLSTEVFHRWEYYDETAGVWKEHGRFSYPISGGRGEGFRGYTLIKNYQPGKWRCSVETARGQVLGRETFDVMEGNRGELTTRVE